MCVVFSLFTDQIWYVGPKGNQPPPPPPPPPPQKSSIHSGGDRRHWLIFMARGTKAPVDTCDRPRHTA